jgi:hypothetical protein
VLISKPGLEGLGNKIDSRKLQTITPRYHLKSAGIC